MNLTARQRASLKRHAHHLKPIHFVGKDGITDASLTAITDAFRTHELIKVKVLEAAPVSAREAGPQLVERVPDSALVQTIGRTVVLYRPDPDKPVLKID